MCLLGKLKVCRLCDFCGNYIYKTDLGPLKELKDKHLQRKQKYTWGTKLLIMHSYIFVFTVYHLLLTYMSRMNAYLCEFV